MRKLPGLILISFVLISASLSASVSLSPKIEKRMDKALKKQLGSAMFKREKITIDTNTELSFVLDDDHLFSLKLENELQGYVLIDEAMGRYHSFSFMVFVNPKLEIKLVYVLQYDEDYGSEISGKKWLAKFKGFNPQSEIKYKQNIDAISGATISSKSITLGISDVLQKLKELKEKGCL